MSKQGTNVSAVYPTLQPQLSNLVLMLITFTLLFGCGESGVANNETPLREASSPETKTDESTSSPGDATPETVTDAPTEVATGTLESEILAAREPVVVLFWAQWCGPCRSLLPVLDRWKETHGDVRFVRKDVDEEPSSAELYDIQTLPTLVRFDNGQETARVVGVLPEDQLASQLGLAAKEPVEVPEEPGVVPKETTLTPPNSTMSKQYLR